MLSMPVKNLLSIFETGHKENILWINKTSSYDTLSLYYNDDMILVFIFQMNLE